MGYTMGSGRWADTRSETLMNGTIVATTTTNGVELGYRANARLDLVISAASGTTPTLDVAIQTSPDNVTWTAVAAFAQQTGAATVHKLFSPLDRFIRVVATVGGTTPSFTFVLSGEAC